jgi:hypothetical protein
MQMKAGPWSFALAFRKQWFAAMSGGASVPFTALAVFLDRRWAQLLFGGCAVVSTWFAAYRVWKSERQRVLELTELTRRRLTISFEPRDPWVIRLPHSNIPDTRLPGAPIVQAPSLWFRVEVSTPEGSQVTHGCTVHLQNVEYSPDGTQPFQATIFGGSQLLRWAEEPRQPFGPRNIAPRQRSFVDVASTDPIHNVLHIKWQQDLIAYEELFQRPGVYRLTLVASSEDGGSSATAVVLLSWTGRWDQTAIHVDTPPAAV